MNFREAEIYLLSLGNEVSTMKLGLENIAKLLNALGDPQDKYLKVQVAGTNGKGSVCAFLRSICLEAGIRAGVYTSPHLVSITERINIGGVDIAEDDFARHATIVRETSERLATHGEIDGIPTFFEQVTAIALLAFAEAQVELAILETGLGGRLDATTAANAEIAAITRIDLDHQQYLGETIEEIAAEKAAIIRPDVKAVVIGEQPAEAMDVIMKRCQAAYIQPKLAELVTTNWGSRWFNARTEKAEYSMTKLSLFGRHQSENAKVAILLAEELQKYFSIAPEQIVKALENTCHPGRLEFRGRFLFDGAHNVGGARALRQFLDEFVEKPITMIFGAMREKQIGQIGEILFPKAGLLILTEPENTRSIPATEIAKAFPTQFSSERIVITTSVADALTKANELSPPENLILVTGSLYLVGEARRCIDKTFDKV